MAINDIKLRVLTYAGLVTKGTDLTPEEADVNFREIYKALVNSQEVIYLPQAIISNKIEIELTGNPRFYIVPVSTGDLSLLDIDEGVSTGVAMVLITNMRSSGDITITADTDIWLGGASTINLANKNSAWFYVINEKKYLVNVSVDNDLKMDKDPTAVDADTLTNASVFQFWKSGIKKITWENIKSTLASIFAPISHSNNNEIHLSAEDRVNLEVCPLDEITTSEDTDVIRITKCLGNAAAYNTLEATPASGIFTLSGDDQPNAFMFTKAWMDVTSPNVFSIINGGGGTDFICFEDLVGYFPDEMPIADIDGIVHTAPDGSVYTFGWSPGSLSINNGTCTHIITVSQVENVGNAYDTANFKVKKENLLKDYAKCATENLTLAVADWNYYADTIEIADGGEDYEADDIITHAGSGVEIKVLTVDGSGTILTAQINDRGEVSTPPANPVAFTGGTGSGAEFNITYTIEQSKTVAGLTATSIVSARVASDNTSFTTAKAYGVRDLSTDTDTITFTCVEEPDDDIDVNLIISKY